MIQRIFGHAFPALVTAAMTAATGSAFAQSSSPPAQAAPSGDARDLLGRARSANEGQMVEDLIRKLGGTGAPAPSTAAPAQLPATTSQPPVAAPGTSEPPAANPPAQSERRQAARRSMPRPMGELMPSRRREAPLAAPIPDSVVMPGPTRDARSDPAPSAAPAQPETPTIAASSPATQTEAAPPPTQQQAAPLTPQQVERMDALPHINVEVLFVTESADLTNQAFATLAILGRALADPRLATQAFLIAGHTDASGPYDYNVALSARRAEAVRDFLVANFRIAPERLLARGFGPDRLRNPANPYGRVNRRVQVVNWTTEMEPNAAQPIPPPPQR